MKKEQEFFYCQCCGTKCNMVDVNWVKRNGALLKMCEICAENEIPAPAPNKRQNVMRVIDYRRY